ncbi:MAG: carbohydrate binding family 9 domain-containing protein [Candidatus Latescibacteria bacterium]|nr:carbohydrate binding family 9 domain-containing protein [Candidatus Latescibacterota bacterium]
MKKINDRTVESYLMNNTVLLKIIFSVIFLLALLFSTSASSQVEKTINAVITPSPIKLDGLLRESAWKKAEVISDFTQRELDEGRPATEKTEVRVLYNENNLYIGIICYDNEPDKIVHNELMWDGEMVNDDNVTIVIDTFNDNRTGYLFCVNPNGARLDALIKNIKEYNTNWNGLWDVKARITAEGWCAEIVIPFLSLRFPDVESHEWGINFKRRIRRKNEQVLWTAWKRDDGILQVSKAGRLTGLTNIKRGKKTEFIPYILSAFEKEKNIDINDKLKYGFDLKYPLTSDLTIDVTTKTDFAQVESDKEKINLTRYSLEYPEKRGFFLEGAEIFNFSQGDSEDYSQEEGINMYYSRRIGITPDPDRQEVPILGGVKLSGKTKKYSIGVMNMQTEEKTVVTSTGTKNFYPSANYTVMRLKRDVLKQSYIGFLGTMVNRSDKPDIALTGLEKKDRFLNKKINHVAAVDFAYNTNSFLKNKNFSAQGYFAASNTPGLSGGNIAGRFALSFPNDIVQAHLSYHGIGENFNPEIGFMKRSGIQNYMGVFAYTPRVDIPYVKKLIFKPFTYTHVTDTGSKLFDRTFEICPLGIEFETDDRIVFEIHNHYRYYDYDFNIFRNIVIPKSARQYWHWMTHYVGNKSRTVSADIMVVGGGYYLGDRMYYRGSCNFKLNKYFSVTPDFIYSDVDNGAESFQTKEIGARFQTNISTRLTSSTLVQYNNELNDVNMNFRIHFIPKIGSDIYIVYNQIWDEENEFDTIMNTAIFKVNYLLMF